MVFGMNESGGGKVLQELEKRPEFSFPIEAQFYCGDALTLKIKIDGTCEESPTWCGRDR